MNSLTIIVKMKKYILLLLFSILLMYCGTRTVKVSGVVTYFFNENFGQKPDLGATIYFLDQNKLNESDKDSLLSLKTPWSVTKLSPKHATNRLKIKQWNLELLNNKSKKNAIEDSLRTVYLEESIDRQKVIDYFKNLMLTSNNEHLKCTANGNGEFNINMPTGRYYILVVFSNREGIDWDFQVIENEQNLSYEFTDFDFDY